MGGGWGMNEGPLYAGGKTVGGLKGDASAAGRALLDSLDTAKGAVHHHKLASALGKYHGEWSKPANQLAADVESAGNKISKTAVIGAETDNHGKHQVHTASVVSPDPLLRHRLNVPSVQ